MRCALLVFVLTLFPLSAAQRLAFEKSLFEVEEGAVVVITVTLSEAVSGEVSVVFETVATTAQPDRDFTAASGTLTFAPGETEKTFEVTTLEDQKFEGAEGFQVVLGEPTGAKLSFLSDASVRILDNDPEPIGLLEDFEDEVDWQSELPLETAELEKDSELALPEQGAFETVLRVGAAGSLERSFATAQDWSAFGGLSFWYYGGGTGETITVDLASARGEVAEQTWPLVWGDDFEGPVGTPPNADVWTYDLGDGMNGWGNGELQYYTDRPENAALDGAGNLVITALELPDDSELRCHYGPCRYSSARIHTAGKLETLYGRVEARMKLPEGQGIWPAFWMLGNDYSVAGWPAAGEIDVMEYIGREPNIVYGHLHGPGYSGGAGPGGPYLNPNGFSDVFHSYAVEWEPGEIRWSVDGEHYLTLGAEDVNGEWVYDHPFYLVLNVAVGGQWPGDPDETTRFPQQLVVDYLRVYALPDTSRRFEARFTDDQEGWHKIELPFETFVPSEDQAEDAPEGELDLQEIWGYRLNLPAPTYIDQIGLEPLR